MAKLPKKVNDKWHKAAEQMIQLDGHCIDIGHNADDPDGDLDRYIHFKRQWQVEATVLTLASKLRRIAAE